MRDVTQASLILVLFHSGISYLRRKKLVPQATIPVLFPFTPTHFSSCPFSCIPSILLVPALPYPWALFNLSSACPQSACYLFSHALVPSPLLSASTPPKILTYFSSTYNPLNPPSSSCPSLLALPHSPGPSRSSCTQPPPARHAATPAFLQAATARALRRQGENQSWHCTLLQREKIKPGEQPTHTPKP